MTGNPSLDKIILLINGAVVTACAGLVFFAHNQIKPPKTDQEREFGKLINSSMTEIKKVPVIYEEITVNLYSRQRRLRFLDTQMNVEIFKEEDRDYMKTLKPFVYDQLIDITGNMKPEELNSITGRTLLETRVKNRVNKYVGRPIIQKIYFSKYIIQ